MAGEVSLGASSGAFITCMGALMLFNFVSGASVLNFESVSGILWAMVIILLVIGLNIVGSGYNETATREIMGIGTIIALLVQIDLPNPFPDIGVGIGTSTLSKFTIDSFGGIPFFFISGIIIIAFIAGIDIVLGG